MRQIRNQPRKEWIFFLAFFIFSEEEATFLFTNLFLLPAALLSGVSSAQLTSLIILCISNLPD